MCYRMLFSETWTVNDVVCDRLVGEILVFTGVTEETYPNT